MNVGLSAEVRYHWFREHLVVVGNWHRLSPSERDRLRHQPMPDEAAQSLRVDLSPWSCGMVFSELLGADLTRFGLCYLAPAEVPASDLTRLGRRLREEFPLLDSQVDSGAEGFELVVHGRPEESPALEVGPFADENALIAALLQRPHSLFERGLLRLFHGRCGGRARWGVWLHHLVADADFASVLLARLAVLNADPTTEAAAPEFGFLQQQWRLERQLRERRTRLEDYWSERGEAFRELASLPWAERASHCEDFRLAATPGGGEAALLTRLACALALALASQGATGKVLALTPVSLRSRRGTAVSGCWLNLVPLLLDAATAEDTFERHRLEAFEHSLLPAEAIAERAGLRYADAQVMINVIDQPFRSAGFIHRPTLKSRLPLTLTLVRRDDGGWDASLASRFGRAGGGHGRGATPMLILLPDFIGHPSCFRGLLARLGATDCRLVDYHRLDAYASIEALASQVLDGLAEEPDWLIGYSFGGLVGYEMARQLPASRLLMIDSHLPWPALRRMPPSEQYQRWLSAEMREWIALMSELGELREEVLLRNVELFGRWQPRHRLARASWVRCRDDAGRDPAAERWCDLIERLDTFPCERPHHLALQDPAVIDFIVHTVSKESVQ